MTDAEIELHIESVVLHGFASLDREAVGRALEAELARLLIARGLPPSLAGNASIESLEAGSFKVAESHARSMVGVQIGQAVYEGMTR